MENKFLFLVLFFVSLLFQNCKKDDEFYTQKIYAEWSNRKAPILMMGNDTKTFVFRKPDYCKYKLEDGDGYYPDIIKDSMTFIIMDKTLHIYQKNGNPYATYQIEKLTNETLVLVDDRGISTKYK